MTSQSLTQQRDPIENSPLKRVKRQGGKFHLQPENASYKTKVYDAHRVQIQGKLVGLLRSY